MPNPVVFISYVIMTTFTPGPNNIMCMSNASQHGIKKSIVFNFGILAGFFLILILCNLFSVSLYNVIPSIKPYMTAIGAIYILWLAWKTFRHKPVSEDSEKKSTVSFISGFLLQFVNPKVLLFGITVVSSFIVPYYKSGVVLTGFAVLIAFTGFTSTCCWSLFGSVFQKCFSKYHRIINSVMALLLVYCAVSLFI